MTLSVLVVDDEPNIVLSLEYLMRRAGYAVRSVSDGEAALRAIGEAPPDLVLLDVDIPKRDGFDVCATVRANPAFDRVRILMLTAKGREVEREKGLALGADRYHTKPFSTKELVATVRDMIGDPHAPPAGT
ncbi:MAG: response regulator [Hyphomicrobiaceae bacterium]|nr:response regulator [Hyphomicrobiaceae bacterium]